MKAGGRAMQPVGSTSVRTAIERVQPLLGLHGHIHESRGAVRIGRTLALNPGSSYEEGVLQGALVTLDPKKAKIKLRAGQRIGPAATAATARTAREGAAA